MCPIKEMLRRMNVLVEGGMATSTQLSTRTSSLQSTTPPFTQIYLFQGGAMKPAAWRTSSTSTVCPPPHAISGNTGQEEKPPLVAGKCQKKVIKESYFNHFGGRAEPWATPPQVEGDLSPEKENCHNHDSHSVMMIKGFTKWRIRIEHNETQLESWDWSDPLVSFKLPGLLPSGSLWWLFHPVWVFSSRQHAVLSCCLYWAMKNKQTNLLG